MSKTGKELLDDLCGCANQIVVDAIERYVEKDDDVAAIREIMHERFSREEALLMIETLRTSMIDAEERAPTLVGGMEVLVMADEHGLVGSCERLFADLAASVDVKPVGRLRRTGHLWREKDIKAWIKARADAVKL